VIFNYTPVPRENYRIGVPGRGYWREILNSDAAEYGGSGKGNMGGVEAVPVPMHGKTHSLTLSLPPLGVLFLKRQKPEEEIEATDGEPEEAEPDEEAEEEPREIADSEDIPFE
jgi:hypothetical protein